MSADDQLVDVGGLLADEPVETRALQDEQSSLYLSVGDPTLRGNPGIGVAIGDQRSLSRPGRRPELPNRGRRALHHPGDVPQPRALLRHPAALRHLL